jgi:DNA primase
MAGIIPPDKLEQIRSANDIVDVIGAVLPLKRAGANFTALCPFHKEKSPSFNVNPHRQTFHCFGCHKGGDVFTFVQEYESLSFVEAVKRLAEKASIPLEFENQPGQQQARHLKEILLQMHEQIAQRWQMALANDAGGQIARDYLSKRGVSEEAIKLFRLGYAPDAWDDTVNWAKSKSYDLALAEQGGLIIRKEDSDRYYDRFRGRLMFPICDEQGRVIGFSGRVLSGDEKTAKYVNSPETPIFTKGKVFYGLDKSKRAILDAGAAIICEGQLDLIACFVAGVKNIVAPQGTAFTGEHARILKRYVDEVILCFDSDSAGQSAAVRVLDGLLAAGLAIRVATVPAPHDPDSFIKQNGGEAFQQLIDKADGFFDFYLRRLCVTNDAATDKGRLAVVKDMAEALHKTGSAVLLDTYAQKTAQSLGVSAESVRMEFRRRTGVRTARQEDTSHVEQPSEAFVPPSWNEFQLLRLLFAAEEHSERVARHLRIEWIPNPTAQHILQCYLALRKENAWKGPAAFLQEVEDDPFAKELLTAIYADPEPLPNPEKQLFDILGRLRDRAINKSIEELKRRLLLPDATSEDQRKLLEEINSLKSQKGALLAE